MSTDDRDWLAQSMGLTGGPILVASIGFISHPITLNKGPLLSASGGYVLGEFPGLPSDRSC